MLNSLRRLELRFRKIFLLFIAFCMLIVCSLTYLNRSYLFIPIYRYQQLSGPYENNITNYSVYTGHEEIGADRGPSPAILLEDGKNLQSVSNSLHQSVKEGGKKSYEFWYSYVYFSSSDNSDPNINGRMYSITYPYVVKKRLANAIYLVTLLLLCYSISVNITWVYRVTWQIRDYFPKNRWNLYITYLIIAILPLAIIVYLFRSDFSAIFLQQVISRDYSYLIICVLILVIGFWLRGWIGTMVTLSTIIIMFLLPLVAIWNNPNVLQVINIGGLLPKSDANNYYIDASALLDGFSIGWSARRPLFVGLLASLLKMTNSNLSYCYILFALINAFGTFFLAKQISEAHSSWAGAVISILSLLYYLTCGIGTTMTENLGLALGLTSLAIAYAAIRTLSKPMILVGIYCLTIALCARAGTFFVIPCLIISVSLIFRKYRKSTPLFTISLLLSVVIGFVTNYILGKVISDNSSEQAQFSNFSYTLYGVVVGGKGWRQVMKDYPLAREGADIYRLAFNHFISHPSDLIRGMVNMWAEYLPGHDNHAFQFVQFNISFITINIQLLLYLLVAAGILWCIINIRNNYAIFVLWLLAGYIASIPFVPPIDGGIRVYAATIGIVFIPVAISVSWIAQLIHNQFNKYIADYKEVLPYRGTSYLPGKSNNFAQILFVVVLLTLTLIGPGIITLTASPPTISDITCQKSQTKIHFRYNPGSRIVVVSNSSGSIESKIPYITLNDIQGNIRNSGFEGDPDAFSSNKTILTAYDVVNKTHMWISLPADLTPANNSIISACGRWSSDRQARELGLFFVESSVAY